MQSGGGQVNGLTLGYNVARLHEANGELKQAETFYSVSHPSCSTSMSRPASASPYIYPFDSLHNCLPMSRWDMQASAKHGSSHECGNACSHEGQ